jgi:heavy metal sensor kinase
MRDDPPGVADSVPPDEWLGPRFPIRFRSRGRLREVVLMGPGRTTIVVGRPIDRELDALSRLTWRLVLTGAGVFAAGLIGGWWLSSRAVGPIAEISRTVEGITASSLSRRIDLKDVDLELGNLAAMINTMLDRLERSFDQQVRFTADASHELRTPLSVVLTQVELALSRPRSEGEYRDALASCGRAARRMKSLVEDLLTLSRADSGHLDLNIEPVDLVAIVDECLEALRPLAERRGVRLIQECGSDPIELMADPDRLAQVVTNLLENAILYNREHGEVRASTETDGEVVVLTVADTGVGIAEDQCPRVFDRFHRVDRARSRETGGSGLGLAIAREIVEAHGGSIEIASAIDHGTTVHVRFRDPLSDPKPEGLARGPFPTPSERGKGPDSAPVELP